MIGYSCPPTLMSQLTHVTPPPARIAAPSATKTPARAFAATPGLPVDVAMAQVIAAKRQPAVFRMQPGYDHSYFFVASFGEDHVRWHADRLNGH